MEVDRVVTESEFGEASRQEGLHKDRFHLCGRPRNGKEYHGFGVRESLEEIRGDRTGMERTGLLKTVWTDWLADLGKQQSKQVRNFSRRADGRTSRADLILLFDGNGRTDMEDAIDLRPRHLVEKHAGVRGQRLHISPLAFGKERVEG